MVSPYLQTPTRSEAEYTVSMLTKPSPYPDGDISNVRLLLTAALAVAKRHADNIPMSDHAFENAEALHDVIDEIMAGYLVPAERSAREYFEREESVLEAS